MVLTSAFYKGPSSPRNGSCFEEGDRSALACPAMGCGLLAWRSRPVLMQGDTPNEEQKSCRLGLGAFSRSTLGF